MRTSRSPSCDPARPATDTRRARTSCAPTTRWFQPGWTVKERPPTETACTGPYGSRSTNGTLVGRGEWAMLGMLGRLWGEGRAHRADPGVRGDGLKVRATAERVEDEAVSTH